jgi:hypothetical protein
MSIVIAADAARQVAPSDAVLASPHSAPLASAGEAAGKSLPKRVSIATLRAAASTASMATTHTSSGKGWSQAVDGASAPSAIPGRGLELAERQPLLSPTRGPAQPDGPKLAAPKGGSPGMQQTTGLAAAPANRATAIEAGGQRTRAAGAGMSRHRSAPGMAPAVPVTQGRLSKIRTALSLRGGPGDSKAARSRYGRGIGPGREAPALGNVSDDTCSDDEDGDDARSVGTARTGASFYTVGGGASMLDLTDAAGFAAELGVYADPASFVQPSHHDGASLSAGRSSGSGAVARGREQPELDVPDEVADEHVDGVRSAARAVQAAAAGAVAVAPRPRSAARGQGALAGSHHQGVGSDAEEVADSRVPAAASLYTAACRDAVAVLTAAGQTRNGGLLFGADIACGSCPRCRRKERTFHRRRRQCSTTPSPAAPDLPILHPPPPGLFPSHAVSHLSAIRGLFLDAKGLTSTLAGLRALLAEPDAIIAGCGLLDAAIDNSTSAAVSAAHAAPTLCRSHFL